MLSFSLTSRGVVYSIEADNVLRLIYLPRAILNVKQLYSDFCAQIFSELAFYGRATFDECVSALRASNSDDEVCYFYLMVFLILFLVSTRF